MCKPCFSLETQTNSSPQSIVSKTNASHVSSRNSSSSLISSTPPPSLSFYYSSLLLFTPLSTFWPPLLCHPYLLLSCSSFSFVLLYPPHNFLYPGLATFVSSTASLHCPFSLLSLPPSPPLPPSSLPPMLKIYLFQTSQLKYCGRYLLILMKPLLDFSDLLHL